MKLLWKSSKNYILCVMHAKIYLPYFIQRDTKIHYEVFYGKSLQKSKDVLKQMVYNSSGKTAVGFPRKEIEKLHCTSESLFFWRSPTQGPLRISSLFLPLSHRYLFSALSLILKWFFSESSHLREVRRGFSNTLFSHLQDV